MADKEVKSSPSKRITERQRLSFIGFDVFPGEAKELFKSDAEKEMYLAGVRAKHEKHEHIRESCTLLEERVSGTDRMVLAIASIIIILTLLLPWYTAYNEIVEEQAPGTPIEEVIAPEEGIDAEVTTPVDPNAEPGQVIETAIQPNDQTPAEDIQAATTDQSSTPNQATAEPPGTEGTYTPASVQGEELITAFAAKKKILREYERLSGIGAILALGSAGSYLFSSGIAVMITVILFLVYTLMCIGIPAYNLYGIFALKGDNDTKALRMKSMLRLNWIPLLVFILGLVISFLGGEYGFDAAEVFTSIGTNYSPLVFLGTLSWGVFISLACFILCAAKGVEI